MAATTFSQPSLAAHGIVVRMKQPVRPRLFDFVSLLCLLLLGYAVLGKLFAYISIGPVYIGEVVLAIGIFGFLIRPANWLILRSRHLLPLIALMTWGLIRTVPYVNEYGVNALRDAVVWGYGLFAIIVAARVVANPKVVSRLLRNFSWFVPLFFLAVPTVWIVTAGTHLLTFAPNGQVVPVLKGTDIMVHLSGVVAFVYLKVHRVGFPWLLLAPVLFGMASGTRAGLLTFLFAVTVLFCIQRHSGRLFLITTLFLSAICIATALDLRVRVPGVQRELSSVAFTESVRSVFVDTGARQFDGTKRWRIMWWNKILDYTVNGPYFWTGKGFGLNLADSDGFAVDTVHTLRSPHNGHLTMLARCGVPGFLLWILAQGCWAAAMIMRHRRCKQQDQPAVASVFLFIFVYWVAFMVSAAFDVFLEGPTAGIWFWSLYGFGVGLLIWHDKALPAVSVVPRYGQ